MYTVNCTALNSFTLLSGALTEKWRRGFAFQLPFFGVAVRLRCFAGVEIARVASSAPSLPFDFAPWTTFPSCRIGSDDILIGSNDGSSLAVKVTFSLSRASSAKSRKSAELQDLPTKEGNGGFITP
ncbi:hypothetical protein IEQ34_026354 [Dendrobium chrysotoxum]|uniref:Uncharacterized protein n=1 Tax=Dendrobium chrysotoxum TaxID=161865 RepID=A0AAV7FLS1_DENCH|nr:hypothetical protein IEQ34_026354 [Dendrobium chrysotoxum]